MLQLALHRPHRAAPLSQAATPWQARKGIVAALMLASIGLPFAASPAGATPIVADHYAPAEFGLIPESVIEQLKASSHIFFGYTSHGSQVITGMEMIRKEDGLYDFGNGAGSLQIDEVCAGIGQPGDTTWIEITRHRLDRSGAAINVVIWSWCWGCPDSSEEGIAAYLQAMNELELDYPGVAFVYMTAPLDGTGPAGNIYVRNRQIREYVESNDKILFDFADIESFDPDGNYYPFGSDACEWCQEWCAWHDCPTCDDCAHSHCLNCYLKAKAFWWLLARIAGWNMPVATEQTTWGGIKASYR